MARKEWTHDAVILGTGQAGKPLARALGRAGWRTAIVERDRVGGSCVNYGCTPTKTLVASARVAYLVRRAGAYGFTVGEPGVDFPRVMARQREIVERFRRGSQQGLEQTPNVELVFGEGRFTAPYRIEVERGSGERRELAAPKIFINTGTRAAVPPIAGLEHVPYLDHASLLELDRLPEHLLVIGGGYIGVEYGQLFRRLGSSVTIVQRAPQLLAREDEDVATALQDILREEGVALYLGAQATRVRREARAIVLDVRTSGGSVALRGTHLLVAAGRVPNTDRLRLEAAGIETDARGFIRVNDRLETSVPGIYALGDVKGGPAFTHISYDDFRAVRSNLLEGGAATIRQRLVPYTVFTDPQLGRVGATEKELQAEQREYRVAQLPMAHVARAVETGETRGFMKALVDGKTGQILGCAILGVEGGELANMIQIAMMGKLAYTVLREAVLPHPTLGESLNNLFMTLDG